MKKFFDKSNSQIVSSRINEVHCWILKTLNRPRNKYGVTHLVKAFAFTLAETLVVMGIIGVVAALTIPNLNQSTGDREKVAKLKKVYANLEDAYGRATAVYGSIDEWYNGDTDTYDYRFFDRITEFLKVSKNDKDNLRVDLADGSSLYFYPSTNANTNADITYAYPDLHYYGEVLVDLDGLNKGKNLYGYDQFYFVITEQGILPDDTAEKTGEDSPATDNGGGTYYATAWVIMNGNMDYLKCYDELNWTDKTSCK